MLRPDHLSPPWSVRVYLDLGLSAQVSWILEQIVDLTCGSSRPASYSPAPGRLGSRCACRSASPVTSQPKPDQIKLEDEDDGCEDHLVDDAEDFLKEEESSLGSLGGRVDDHLHHLLGKADSAL